MFLSPDGINWSVQQSTSISNFWAVGTDGETIVASGHSGTVSTEDNGASWQTSGESGFKDLLWTGLRWVAVGIGGVKTAP